MAERIARHAGRIATLERGFVTPEGVDLRLQLGQAGQRAAAFLLDALIMIAALVALTLLLLFGLFATGGKAPEVTVIVWLVGFFALRNTYFIVFEMGARAATPGKRALGLRVVARDGGRLTGDAVIARNAMREIEVYLPLSFLAYQAGAGQADAWTALFGLGWTGIFLFFPLFNRDRLRVGDLLAGTWVVRVARRDLGLDLMDDAAADAVPLFSDAHLDAYGEYELQTLEEVLRQPDPQAVAVVAASIRAKIGWEGGDDLVFLQAYYAALCRRLERGLLFGQRRRDKHDRAVTRR